MLFLEGFEVLLLAVHEDEYVLVHDVLRLRNLGQHAKELRRHLRLIRRTVAIGVLVQ